MQEFAFEINIYAAAVSMFAVVVSFALWRKMRWRYMPPFILGWFGMVAYWSLLAVTAGPAPAIARGDIAAPIRGIEVIMMSAFAWGFVAQAAALMRGRRGRNST